MSSDKRTTPSQFRDANGDAGNALVRQLGQLLDTSGDCSAYENENFVAWLEREVSGRISVADRRESEIAAQRIVRRAQARIRSLRVGDALATHPFRARAAAVVGNVKQIAHAASDSGCAPWVESLAVAAGSGREIWDEPCEQWAELPNGIGTGEHIALTVAGDSMTPCLHSGDIILVDTHKSVARDSIVVARRDEDGYVVKHVTRCGKRALELSSFNTEYAPFMIEREPGAIIGVVVARLVRDGGA
jgi:SOS-response transcriptional repressor LexA